MTATEIQNLTPQELDELFADTPEQIPCPECQGKSQESDDAPHCGHCEDYGWFPNPAHPDNW